MTLFNGDLKAQRHRLSGACARAWDAIVLGVLGGERAGLLAQIGGNTRAGRGRAGAQKTQLRDQIMQLRDQIASANDLDIAHFVNDVARLLDAASNPASHGASLRDM